MLLHEALKINGSKFILILFISTSHSHLLCVSLMMHVYSSVKRNIYETFNEMFIVYIAFKSKSHPMGYVVGESSTFLLVFMLVRFTCIIGEIDYFM